MNAIVWILFKILEFISPSTTLCGIRVVFADGNQLKVETSLSRALQMIEDVDPRRIRRFRHDVSKIVITGRRGAQFIRAARVCALSTPVAHSDDVVMLASVLVHEGTHARLRRFADSRSEAHRGRVERICVGAEIDFLGRLGGEEHRITQRLQSLAANRPWFSNEEIDRRQREDGREIGLPNWLIRWAERRRWKGHKQ